MLQLLMALGKVKKINKIGRHFPGTQLDLRAGSVFSTEFCFEEYPLYMTTFIHL